MSTPAIFRRTGQGHLLAAEILSEHQFRSDGSRSPIFFPYYNNLGLSIELYLKCFLSLGGIKSSRLQTRPFGHDIPYMYSVCAEMYGMNFRRADMAKIIELIGDYYYNHAYRYQTDSSLAGTISSGAATTATFETLKQFDNYLDDLIIQHSQEI